MARFTFEIDCRNCINLNATKDSCKIYGENADVAVKNCSANCFKNFKDMRNQ